MHDQLSVNYVLLNRHVKSFPGILFYFFIVSCFSYMEEHG